MKNILKLLLHPIVEKEYYSQDFEDALLNNILDIKKPGFFVDVGSAHPVNASNSYLFYLNGWRGLCVDASPGLIGLYQKHRPKDLFINAFVGKCSGTRDFYIFNEPFLNTGSRQRKDFLSEKTDYEFQKQVSVQQLPLKEILERNMPPEKTIEFMSLDVEEGELEVLESNDWSRYRPRVVVMEVLHQDREKIGENSAVQYLKKQGYRPSIILPRSVFFTAL
jgi:hypothetical protein